MDEKEPESDEPPEIPAPPSLDPPPETPPSPPPSIPPPSKNPIPPKPPPSIKAPDYSEIEKTLREIRTLDTILEKPTKSVRKLQSSFEEEDYERTISNGIKFEGIMGGVEEKYERMRRAYVICAFRKLINDSDAADIDVSKPKKLLNDMVVHFNEKQYKDVDGKIQELTDQVMELQNKRSKKVKDIIFSTESFIGDAKDLNADISEAAGFLRQAEDMYFSKNYNKAVYFAMKAKRAAEGAREHLVKGISDAMLFVKTVIVDAKGIGADVTEPEELHQKAREAFKAEEYAKCKKLLKESEQLALELQDAQIQKAMLLKGKTLDDTAKPKVADLTKSMVEVQTEQQPSGPQQKTRCPNCGQRFAVKKGPKPFRIECPYCGLRGWMH
jgi:hypothetical protein